MRAWPPLQAVLVLAALGLLAVPLVHLTGDSPPAPRVAGDVAEPDTPGPVSGWLAVRFAHAPIEARVLVGDEVLWEGAEDAELALSLPIEDGHLELAVEVQWPDGTPHTAVEVEITPDGYESRKETLWGEAETREIVDFHFR